MSVVSTLMPQASFVVAGVPLTAATLQWLAVAVGLFIATSLPLWPARKRVDNTFWRCAIVGIVVARLFFLIGAWQAAGFRGAFGGPFGGASTPSAGAGVSGAVPADWWHGLLRIVDIRDGGLAMLPGVLAALLVAGVVAWRAPLQRRGLAAGALVAIVLWCGVGAALSLSAQGRPDLPALTLARVNMTPSAMSAVSAPIPALDTLDLKDNDGRPTLINLWATWCGPCKREMPVLARAQQDRADIRFVFADQGETAGQVTAFMTELMSQRRIGLRDVVLDPDARLGALYRSSVVPTTLLFDAAGHLQDVHFGELTDAGLQVMLARVRPSP